MADGKKVAAAGISLGLAAVLGRVVLYRHGVEVYLFEAPREVAANEPFSSTLGLINRSDITRDGWVEQFVDGIGPFDVEHLTLQPGESWEKTYEGFDFHEAGLHEFCWGIDTFNKDLSGWPSLLKAPQMVCKKIRVVP